MPMRDCIEVVARPRKLPMLHTDEDGGAYRRGIMAGTERAG